MLLSVLTFLCLFCTLTSVASTSSGTCIIPDNQQVKNLESQLVEYANLLSSPDPSILIALNLAEYQDISERKLLLQQLKATAAKEMTSGKVALYVLALQSSCENPDNVTTPGKNVNLVHVLENKTKEEIEHYNQYGTPKTIYYWLALDVLALCIENSSDAKMSAIILAKAALYNALQSFGSFSVDTGAVASLALTCVYNGLKKTQQTHVENVTKNTDQDEFMEIVKDALNHITNQILGEQKNDGVIGNIYSTGLAMQALSVTSEFYIDGTWNCSKTLHKVLEEVSQGTFNTPGAASQILPSLVGKTYLDIPGLDCSSENVTPITVNYTIINQLAKPYFSISTTVEVPKGSILLAVLEAAQSSKPGQFSFQTEQTSWGPMVVSINGAQASEDENTAWLFYNGTTPLDKGVASYKPTDNEHIEAIFSRY